MIKFILAARRKPGDTQERYFYEWGIIHVALMLTTPAVMETFRRYVQHYSIAGVTNDVLIHPLSDMGWDNMADHWLESTDDFAPILHSQAYVERMQPHKFGDDAFNIELTSGDVVYDFTHPTNPSPKPAVLDPASLEALVDAQGYRDWNVPPGPHGR